MNSSRKPFIFIMGPTASGKSEWALRLAQEFRGVILNCDSVQVYKFLDIGAAKPSARDRDLVPHYLFDYVLPPEEMTAGVFSRDFYNQLDLTPEGTPVFVVGGTGFYFMAIEKGMYPVLPVPSSLKQQVAQELSSEEGRLRLYEEIKVKDPDYAKKIHSSDTYRIGRAVELIRSQNKSVSKIQSEFSQSQSNFPYPLLKIGLDWDRETLNQRIIARSKAMITAGLIEEVQSLLDKGLEKWAPLSSVGYREAKDFINGEINEAELLESIVISTRQLAKRQKTWFKRDPELKWFSGANGFEAARAQVEKFLNPFDGAHWKA